MLSLKYVMFECSGPPRHNSKIVSDLRTVRLRHGHVDMIIVTKLLATIIIY